MPAKFRTKDPVDFDPFEDAPVPIAAVYEPQDIVSVEPAQLQNVEFTILDIVEEPQPNDAYHFFKWRLFVQSEDSGKKFTFMLNPAKARNKTLEILGKELPVKHMTLVQKTFTEQRNFKLITYYELSKYNPSSGTITH